MGDVIHVAFGIERSWQEIEQAFADAAERLTPADAHTPEFRAACAKEFTRAVRECCEESARSFSFNAPTSLSEAERDALRTEIAALMNTACTESCMRLLKGWQRGVLSVLANTRS